MARFTMSVDMDNAAFDDEPASMLAAILHNLAGAIEGGTTPPREGFPIYDSNGNRVGVWQITEGEG